MSSDKQQQQSINPSPIFILQNSKAITCLLFSSKNKHILYVGNRNGDLTIYDISLRRSIFTANPNQESILSIFELDEDNFLTYCRNGSIFKWNNYKSECVYQNENFTFCQFDIYENRIYLPSNKASIIDCIDLNSFNSPILSSTPKNQSAQEQRGMLMNLKVIKDLNKLMVGYENGELVIFDLKTLNEIENIQIFNGQPIMCFDFNDKFGFAGSAENELISLKYENSLFTKSEPIKLVNPGLNCIRIRKNDSKIFATGGWDSRIRVYSIKKQKFLACLDFHKEAINSIDFSIDNCMAAGSNDGIISFWNLY